MRQYLSVLVAVSMLTMGFVAVPGLAGQHEDQDNQAPEDPGQDQRPDDRMDPSERQAWAHEKRQQALDRAQQAGLFGHLSYDDGDIEGTFIDSHLDEAAGALADHSVIRNETHSVLDRFDVDADVDGNVTVRPATVVLPFEDGELRINDNPTALVQYRSSAPVNATVTLADGVDGDAVEDADKVKLTGSVNGTLLVTGEGDVSIDGDTVSAELHEAGTVLVQLQPNEPGQRVSQKALEHAAQADRLGGELRVSGAAGEPVDQETPVDVNMSAQHATNGQAIVEIDGDHDESRVVHVTVAKDNLPVDDPAEVEPKLDRETLPKVDSIDDVINATGDAAVAHVAVHERVVEITVNVPDFSLHSLNVQDATQDVTDIPTPLDSPNPTGLGISLAEQAKQRALSQAQAWDQLGPDQQAQATAQAQSAGLFGQANLELDTLQGTHVQASVDAEAGVLQDYRLLDQASTVFEEVRPSEFTPAEQAQQSGPAVALLGDEIVVIAHDTPNGQLELKAGDDATHVDLQVNPDADIDRVDEHTLEITTPGDATVHLVHTAGDADFIVEGDTILANLGANAAVQAIASADADVPGEANLEERVSAAAEGDLGAEASITAVEDTPVEDKVETSVELDTQDVSEGSVTVSASSQVDEPRAVTLNLDPAIVDQVPADQLQVLIDGQAIQAADNAEQVLEASEAQASFHAEQAGDGLQVLVNLEGFSEHDITVQEEEDTDDSGTSDDSDDSDTTDGGADGSAEDGEETPFLGILAVLGSVLVAAAARER